MAQALVKLQKKGQMVIPRALREQAGVAEGTLMKVAVTKSGQFLLTPHVTMDRVHSHAGSKQAFGDLAQVMAELRKEAKEQGLDSVPMREIDRAVAAARRDLKKNAKRSSK
jgi:AbrB family looped-hinge helix DNA binding protein